MSFWNSLRFKMPGIVLLGIIPPMLGAIFFASYRANLRLRQDAQENIASQAKIVANTVSWWNQLNVSTLKQLSQQT
ncbi:MAG: chemotaxis protein, partial [Pleurocapsa sp. MO_192.B19]|nr:chemotaxis protein [Pleurocapsa sp. MO_192.B19]